MERTARRQEEEAQRHIASGFGGSTPARRNSSVRRSMCHSAIEGFEGTIHLADVDPLLAFARMKFPEKTSNTLLTVNISHEIAITDLNTFTILTNSMPRFIIPKPLVLTLDIGKTTFAVYFNNSDIGTNYISDLVLHPRDNDYFFRADIRERPVVTALTQRIYCERGRVLSFQLTGKTVANNGGRE
ncbi:hypothetical protein F4779DRAFT_618177 [Xylariaceae sp. FL0662B]|nr:hypothetical protein F4779DRAFT_618177 [Xylariaceae sp. FL0662B]